MRDILSKDFFALFPPGEILRGYVRDYRWMSELYDQLLTESEWWTRLQWVSWIDLRAPFVSGRLRADARVVYQLLSQGNPHNSKHVQDLVDLMHNFGYCSTPKEMFLARLNDLIGEVIKEDTHLEALSREDRVFYYLKHTGRYRWRLSGVAGVADLQYRDKVQRLLPTANRMEVENRATRMRSECVKEWLNPFKQ